MYTLDDVLNVLNGMDLSRENPKPGCVYTGPDGNHCIAGQVCVEFGIEVPEWDDLVGNTFSVNENPNTRTFNASPMAANFDAEAVSFLTMCQDYADNRPGDWADCVYYAKSELALD